MRDPFKIITLLWLLCLTIYVVVGNRGGDARELSDVADRLRTLEDGAGAHASMNGFNLPVPKSGGFKILHAPNGKWRLFRRDTWIADFETHAEAEDGMQLCINPEIQHYNDTGQPVDG